MIKNATRTQLLAEIKRLEDYILYEGETPGMCEVCGNYILGNEEYDQDREGVMWHRNSNDCIHP